MCVGMGWPALATSARRVPVTDGETLVLCCRGMVWCVVLFVVCCVCLCCVCCTCVACVARVLRGVGRALQREADAQAQSYASEVGVGLDAVIAKAKPAFGAYEGYLL